MSTFFSQEGKLGLRAHHSDKNEGKAHEHERGRPLVGKEDGEKDARERRTAAVEGAVYFWPMFWNRRAPQEAKITR